MDTGSTLARIRFSRENLNLIDHEYIHQPKGRTAFRATEVGYAAKRRHLSKKYSLVEGNHHEIRQKAAAEIS
jgi:hypothetical protein